MIPDTQLPHRRDLLAAGAAGLAAFTGLAGQASAAAESAPAGDKQYRIGVISSRINGKPQPTNGHTWHFAQYLHPEINLEAIKKYLDPGSAQFFATVLRDPKCNFGILPFPDCRITHYYEADPKLAEMYCEAFPGVQVATSPEQLAKEVDAVWLGDASGFGEDHFDLLAPSLERGLPTFCDKPIGASVAGTRKILDFAKQHQAPIMSSSIFRYEWGMEEALRLRDSGEFGPLQYVLASLMGGFTDDGWLVYGQHPVWSIITLCGAGVDAVSLYSREHAAHGYVTYKDRAPAEIWYGRPDYRDYNETFVHFEKRLFKFSPSIENNFWYGHHYEMFSMARAFLNMAKTKVEPVPHQEILEVTAVIHAGVKSKAEQSRLVKLEEVMG